MSVEIRGVSLNGSETIRVDEHPGASAVVDLKVIRFWDESFHIWTYPRQISIWHAVGIKRIDSCLSSKEQKMSSSERMNPRRSTVDFEISSIHDFREARTHWNFRNDRKTKERRRAVFTGCRGDGCWAEPILRRRVGSSSFLSSSESSWRSSWSPNRLIVVMKNTVFVVKKSVSANNIRQRRHILCGKCPFRMIASIDWFWRGCRSLSVGFRGRRVRSGRELLQTLWIQAEAVQMIRNSNSDGSGVRGQKRGSIVHIRFLFRQIISRPRHPIVDISRSTVHFIQKISCHSSGKWAQNEWMRCEQLLRRRSLFRILCEALPHKVVEQWGPSMLVFEMWRLVSTLRHQIQHLHRMKIEKWWLAFTKLDGGYSGGPDIALHSVSATFLDTSHFRSHPETQLIFSKKNWEIFWEN